MEVCPLEKKQKLAKSTTPEAHNHSHFAHMNLRLLNNNDMLSI